MRRGWWWGELAKSLTRGEDRFLPFRWPRCAGGALGLGEGGRHRGEVQDAPGALGSSRSCSSAPVQGSRHRTGLVPLPSPALSPHLRSLIRARLLLLVFMPIFQENKLHSCKLSRAAKQVALLQSSSPLPFPMVPKLQRGACRAGAAWQQGGGCIHTRFRWFLLGLSTPSRRATDSSQAAGSPGVTLWLCIVPAHVGPGPNELAGVTPLESKAQRDGNPTDGKNLLCFTPRCCSWARCCSYGPLCEPRAWVQGSRNVVSQSQRLGEFSLVPQGARSRSLPRIQHLHN